MNVYQTRAADTRSRRTYRRPTKAQRAAMQKLLSRDGSRHLSAEECALLGDHPGLTVSQRAEFSNRAIAMGW